MTDTKHTDSVEAKNIAIHLTAILDKEVFKGQYSSSGLEAIEAIINRELTSLQATQSQQVEEAVREMYEIAGTNADHYEGSEKGFGNTFVKMFLEDYAKAKNISLTPNHQD